MAAVFRELAIGRTDADVSRTRAQVPPDRAAATELKGKLAAGPVEVFDTFYIK